MSLPWSAQQIEWLQAMGLEVLQRPGQGALPGDTTSVASSQSATREGDVPAGLARAARGVDLGALLAAYGTPRDVASRRAFWRALRAARKAARHA
ncbi:hypothetical protein [Cognatilysobacter terrigena]|uniref:hypothetical protein n=1 Tax=Cognatilysobacter terrigena TaxID=2488749 RepID=UPI001061785C|nr:hypothetical protein [Lysobacter terrigena]